MTTVRTRFAVRSVAAAAVPQIVGALLALLAIRAYATCLTPSDLGLAMLALSAFALADTAMGSSVFQVLLRRLATGGNARGLALRAPRVAARLSSFGATVIAIALLVIGLTLAAGHNNRFGEFVCLCAAAIGYSACEVARNGAGAFLHTRCSRRQYGAAVIVDAVASSGLGMVAAYTSQSAAGVAAAYVIGKGIASIIYSLIATQASTGIAQRAFRRGWIWRARSDALPIEYIKRLALKAGPFVAMAAVGWATTSADRVVVAAAAGTADAGIYGVASALVTRVFAVAGSSAVIHFRPTMYRLVSVRNSTEVAHVRRKWILTALAFTVFSFAIVAVAGEVVLPYVVGADLSDAVYPIAMMFVASCGLVLVSHAYDNEVLAQGQEGRLLILQVVTLPLMALAIGVGAYSGGAFGAAAGRVVAESIRTFAAQTLASLLRRGW